MPDLADKDILSKLSSLKSALDNASSIVQKSIAP